MLGDQLLVSECIQRDTRKQQNELYEIKQIQGTVTYIALTEIKGSLNPICHLLALLGAHHILHIFWIRVKLRLFSKSQKIYNEI